MDSKNVINIQQTQYQNSDIFSKVLKEVDKTIRQVGVEEFLSILKQSRKINDIESNSHKIEKAFHIINLTCDEFNLSLEQFFGNKRNNDRAFAIGVCAFLIESFLNIDNTDISFLLKKSGSRISVYKNQINRLSYTHPTDLAILQKIENIKFKINNPEPPVDEIKKNE